MALVVVYCITIFFIALSIYSNTYPTGTQTIQVPVDIELTPSKLTRQVTVKIPKGYYANRIHFVAQNDATFPAATTLAFAAASTAAKLTAETYDVMNTTNLNFFGEENDVVNSGTAVITGRAVRVNLEYPTTSTQHAAMFGSPSFTFTLTVSEAPIANARIKAYVTMQPINSVG